jgi:hypothetical protein
MGGIFKNNYNAGKNLLQGIVTDVSGIVYKTM